MVAVLEKESRLGAHQTGHNSGVIHSGIYYRPGSFRARLCVAGARSMVAFCQEQGVPVQVCGKLIVATRADELPRLHALAQRARANGLPAPLVGPAEAGQIEPEVSCLAALHLTTTGITDFGRVCEVLGEQIQKAGGEVRLDTRVLELRPGLVVTSAGEYPADLVI